MQPHHFLLQHELISIVKRYPQKTALILDGTAVLYEKLLADVLGFASYFKECHLKNGDRVLIQSGNSYLTIVGFFAALFCEAIPCPLDENTPLDIRQSLLASLAPAIVIVSDCLNPNNSDLHKKNCICLDNIFLGKENFHALFKNTEQDLAIIMHTSGSTHLPKGVMLSHRNVLSAVAAIASYLDIQSTDIILSVLPLHFDYGLYQVLLSLSAGATLLLEKNALFINKSMNKILEKKVSIIPCVPYLIQMMHCYFEKYRSIYPSVRMITNTGENLTKSHVDKIKRLFPKADVFSMYGLTECKRCSYVPPKMLTKKMDSIGIPMPNLAMWIEDDNGVPVLPMIEGNLVVSGPSVMMGYWKNPEQTALKIKLSPSYQKILLTGDRAVMDEEGYFYFRGRRDGLVKFKGLKLCSQSYIKKINAIECVSRSYLCLHDNLLIVCVEIEKNDDKLQSSIFSLFPIDQKPSGFYQSNQFPSLSNGKLDIKTLEILAKHSVMGAKNS